MTPDMQKRTVDVAVISDVHLGTLGCHAKELLVYLNSIDPKILVLNGDIIDIWNFTKLYWPETHMAIIHRIMAFVVSGIPVYYITGNHDELLRKFSGFKLSNFHLCDKLVLDIDGRKCWMFHGDVFDITMRYSKWLARLGAIGYDLLIMINKLVSFVSQSLGKGKISLSKRIKDSVKQAVNFVEDFEKTAVDLAIESGYDYVVCGHIHKPQIRECHNEHGHCIYLNSGDWIENHTALEYTDGHWSLYRYPTYTATSLNVPLTLEMSMPILGIQQVGIRELEVA